MTRRLFPAIAIVLSLCPLSCGSHDDATVSTDQADLRRHRDAGQGSTSDGGTVNKDPGNDPGAGATACTAAGTTLGAGNFCLTFDDTSAITELKYGSAGTAIAVEAGPSSMSEGGAVTALAAEDAGNGAKKLTYTYANGATSTVAVTPYPRFLDFQLQDVGGSPGEITLLKTSFPLHATAFNDTLVADGGFIDFVELPNGFYAGIVKATAQTQVWTNNAGLTEIYAVSPAELPAADRGQRFALFVAQADELPAVISDIESAYGIPVGIKAKQRPESNYDYFFLTDTNGASPDEIVALMTSMGMKNVLIELHVWCDWDSPSAPWQVKQEGLDLANALKAAGILVGAHSFVHNVSATGYYAKTYPDMVSAAKNDVGFVYKYGTPLLEMAATDYAAAVKSLGADWVYFDGAEQLYDNGSGTLVDSLNWYLRPLVADTMLKSLAAAGIEPVTFQTSSTYIDSYHSVTRLGQVDYWDNATTNPTQLITSLATRLPTAVVAKAFLRPDLGWFPMCVHTDQGCREPTLDEWKLVTETSVATDAPLGIEAGYQDIVKSANKDAIVQLVHDAIVKRGGTP